MLTDSEKKVFINWSEEHTGTTRGFILVNNRADAEAFWTDIPMPMVLISWDEKGVEWLRPYVEKGWFASVEIIYLAGPKGSDKETGADMLTRLLGSARCVVCDWGEYSSAAEVSEKEGLPGLVGAIDDARHHPYQPVGVVTLDALLPELEAMRSGSDMFQGLSLHWGEDFDEHCRFNPGSVAIVVGKEGEGKSSWVDELTMRLALVHDLKISVWTPEAKFMTLHSEKLLRLLFQRDTIQNIPPEDFRKGYEFLKEHYVYIDFPFPKDYERMTREEQLRYEPTLDNLMTRAYHNAESFGARVFVFDPLLLVSRTDPRQHEIDFARDVINRAKLLALRYQAIVILVTHPHRLNATDLQRSDRPVTTQDIYGSGQYAFLLDYTFAVNRFDKNETRQKAYVLLDIGKVKQQRFGYRGTVFYTFQPRGERFIPAKMGKVAPEDGKGPSHLEPERICVNPKRWLDGEGKPDLAAIEFSLPVSEEEEGGLRSKVKGQRPEEIGQRSKVKGQRSEEGGLRSEEIGQRSKVKGQRSAENREPLTVNREPLTVLRAMPAESPLWGENREPLTVSREPTVLA